MNCDGSFRAENKKNEMFCERCCEKTLKWIHNNKYGCVRTYAVRTVYVLTHT